MENLEIGKEILSISGSIELEKQKPK